MKKINQLDIEYVVKALKAKDNGVCQRFVSCYSPLVRKAVSKTLGKNEDVDDLISEIFTKAFNKIHLYKLDFSITTWLYSISINHCIDYLRKRSTTNRNIHYDDNILVNEDLFDTKESIDVNITKIIISLPEKYQDVFQLRYLQNCKYRQIGGILNIPIGTVKTRLYRGKSLLLKKVKKRKFFE